jgi:hypothetical protein
MKLSMRIVVVFLCFSIGTYGDGNTFDRVRYNGGSVASKVDPKDWHNTLVINSDAIAMSFKDGQKLSILPKSVTSLSYGQEAHRRVGTMIALAILVAPVALFGLLHKTRLHYIGIQYLDGDGKSAGILLQGDKDNYRAILVALQGVTSAPVSVSDKDREFVPVGIKSEVAGGDERPAAAKPGIVDSSRGAVNVSSIPANADVLLDGTFVGNAPAALKLTPGKHTIVVKSTGFADWTREISVQADSDVQLTATLQKLE